MDGKLTDWQQMRRHSAEYLIRGTIAEMDDFQGGLRVAYNKDWLFLALDSKDSELIFNSRRGDRVTVVLESLKRKTRFGFSFKRKFGTKIFKKE